MINKDQLTLIQRRRFPFREIGGDGNQTRAWFHLFFQMRSQFHRFCRCGIHKDDICITQIRLVKVPPLDLNLIPKPTCDEVQPDQSTLNRSHLDANGFCPKLARGDKQYAPIPGAEVIQRFPWLEICQPQSFADSFLFCGNGRQSVESWDEDPKKNQNKEKNAQPIYEQEDHTSLLSPRRNQARRRGKITS